VKLGKFIVLEGLDGSGKTTQIKRLVDYLSKNKHHCLTTKEPTDGPIGSLALETIRGLSSLSPDTLALLFAADRSEHILRKIRPALQAGINIICDRFVYSNLAYQGETIPQNTIFAYNSQFLLPPDLTIFIDTSPEECTRRIISTRKSFELFDGVKRASNIRNEFLKAFVTYGKQMPVKIIDGNLDEDEVFKQLINAVEELLGQEVFDSTYSQISMNT